MAEEKSYYQFIEDWWYSLDRDQQIQYQKDYGIWRHDLGIDIYDIENM
jgi:hypothetical protein